MKFAPVCPIHIYEFLEKNDPIALGDYFLLLAHDVIEHSKRYEAFFKRRDCTIIMDNSVIELGDAVTASMLYDACSIVNATCVVIPDVLERGQDTHFAATRFLDDWEQVRGTAKDYDKLYLPQGFDGRDFEACLQAGLTDFGREIGWIGIPRNLTGRVYKSRTEAVDMVLNVILPDVKIHLFGFSDNTADDLWVAKLYRECIEGIDSAVPMRINEPLKDPIQDAGKRGTWWDTCEYTPQMALNINTVRKRIGEIV